MTINPFNIETAFAQTAAEQSSETLTFIQSAIEFLWLQVPRWIAALILVLLTFVAAKMAKNIVVSKMAEKGIEEEHQEISILAGRTTNAGVLIVGITVALKVGGIDLTTILAAVAFGIGFALRDLIMNFLAGAMILLSRQFTIGDFIKVNDTIGKVEEIQTRATILKALDGTKIIVPNADLFTNQVISYTSNAFRRIEVIVGVEYDTNLAVAMETVKRALSKTNRILLEPKPAVLFQEFGDSSINMSVRFWVESRGGWLQIRSEAIQNIKKEFDQVGIGIPFPIRTVYQAHERDLNEFQLSQQTAFGKSTPTETSAPIQQPAPTPAPTQPEQPAAPATPTTPAPTPTPTPIPEQQQEAAPSIDQSTANQAPTVEIPPQPLQPAPATNNPEQS